MDTNLMTISNLIAPAENVSATLSNTSASNQTSRSSIISNNRYGAEKTKTTDNSFRQVHKKAIEKQSGDSEQSLDKTQATTQTTETQDSTKSKIQQTGNETTSDVNQSQTCPKEDSTVVTVLPIQKTNEQVSVDQTLINETSNTTASLQSNESPDTGIQTIEPTSVESSELVNIVPDTKNQSVPMQTSQIQSGNEDSKNEASINSLDDVLAQKTDDSTVEKQTLKSENGNSEQVVVSDSGQKQFAAQINTGNEQIKADAPTTDTTQVTSLMSETKQASELTAQSNIETSATDGKTTEITTNSQAVQTKSTEPQILQANIDTDKSGQSAEKQMDDNTDGLKTFSQTSNESNKETLDIRNDASGDSAARKLNFTDVQISADEPKDHGNSATDGNSNTASEQILNFNTLQNTATEQSLNSTSSTKSTELISQNHQSEPSADIGKQILESIHSSMTRQGADQQITVRLNPPELGNVVIKFQEQDNQVTGLLEVSKSQTRFEIEQALPQIAKSLSDAGIQVRRLEVVLSNHEDLGREASREHLMQNGDSRNQNANNSDSWQNGPDRGEINEFLVNNINYQYKSGLQDAFATSGSINMLM